MGTFYISIEYLLCSGVNFTLSKLLYSRSGANGGSKVFKKVLKNA
jgi:hypothetical protein